MTPLRRSLAGLLAALAPFTALAAPPEPGMRLQDAVPPVFVAVRVIEPGEEWARWLAGREGAHLHLPFTIWRGPLGEVTQAQLGADRWLTPQPVRLQDDALGVSLVDRLRARCGAPPEPCRIWLSGLWRGATDGQPARLELRAVGDPLSEAGPWAASVIRAPSCLVIRVQKALHCARGPERCTKCREAADGPALPKLLDLCPEGDVARPVVTFTRAGKEEHRVYDVVRTFPSLEEAKAFAGKHRIELLDAAP